MDVNTGTLRMLSPLDRAIGMIEEFRKIDPEMQLQTVWIFLLIAKHEGCSQHYLSQITGYTRTAISRNCGVLSDVGSRNNGNGHRLIVQKVDPNDRRARVLELTPKGRMIFASVIRFFDDQEGDKET